MTDDKKQTAQSYEDKIKNLYGLTFDEPKPEPDQQQSSMLLDDETYQKELERLMKGNVQPEPPKPVTSPVTQPETEEKGGFFTEIYQQLQQGASTFNAAIQGAPGYLYDLAGAPFRKAGLNVPTYKESGFAKELNVAGVDINPLSQLEKQKEGWLNAAKVNAAKVKEINPEIEKGALEPILQGDFKTGFRNLFSSVAQSAPASIALMTTGGMSAGSTLAAGGAVFGSMNTNEADQKNDYGKFSRDGMLAVSALTGTLEMFWERQLGSGAAGKALANMIRKQGKEQAETQIKRSFGDNIALMIEKNPVLAMFGEGYEEMGTQLSQNIVEKYSGMRPEINVMDNVFEAGLQGIAMGSVHSAILGTTKKGLEALNPAMLQHAPESTASFLVNADNSKVTPEQRSARKKNGYVQTGSILNEAGEMQDVEIVQKLDKGYVAYTTDGDQVIVPNDAMIRVDQVPLRDFNKFLDGLQKNQNKARELSRQIEEARTDRKIQRNANYIAQRGFNEQMGGYLEVRLNEKPESDSYDDSNAQFGYVIGSFDGNEVTIFNPQTNKVELREKKEFFGDPHFIKADQKGFAEQLIQNFKQSQIPANGQDTKKIESDETKAFADKLSVGLSVTDPQTNDVIDIVDITTLDEGFVLVSRMDADGNETTSQLPVDLALDLFAPSIAEKETKPTDTAPPVTPTSHNAPAVTQQGNETTPKAEEVPAAMTEKQIADAEKPQIPVNKQGEIEFDKITDPEMYAQGLRQEFAEEAPAVLSELISEAQQAVEKAKASKNAIERVRKTKAAQSELDKLQKVQQLMNPAQEEEQPTTSTPENVVSEVQNEGENVVPGQQSDIVEAPEDQKGLEEKKDDIERRRQDESDNRIQGYDPDLAKIDPAIIAARAGDKQAQKKFEKYGLEWEQTTTYRFVGQSEVDVLLSNNKVESKRGMADAGIDVTTSPKVTSAASNEYRVTFKESFDVNNGLGKVKSKSKEEGDHHLEKGRGYDINDVAKIEKIDEKGNVVETIYESAPTQYTEAAGVSGSELKDVESKKADIERRRQEELENTDLYQYDKNFKEFQTYGNTVKEAFDNLFEQVKNNPTDKKLSDLLDYINERLVPEDIRQDSDKNPLVQEYIDDNQKNIEKASKSPKSRISKINAKYDAELAALQQPAAPAPQEKTQEPSRTQLEAEADEATKTFLDAYKETQEEPNTITNEQDLQKPTTEEPVQQPMQEVEQQPQAEAGTQRVGQENQPFAGGVALKPKKRRAKSISKVQQDALAEEPINARDLAMHYFIAGGKINKRAIESLFGGGKRLTGDQKNPSVESEWNAKKWMRDNKFGMDINGIAHMLWEDNQDQFPQLTTSDYRDAVEEVLLSYNHPTHIANEYLKSRKQGDNLGLTDEQIAEMQEQADEAARLEQEIYDEDFRRTIEEAENNQQIPSDEEYLTLFLPNEYKDGTESIQTGIEPTGERPTPQGEGRTDIAPDEENRNEQDRSPGDDGGIPQQQEVAAKPTREQQIAEKKKQVESLTKQYHEAKNKHAKLKNTLETSDQYGQKGQSDIFGNIAGSDMIDFGDGTKEARELVDKAAKQMNELREKVSKATIELNDMENLSENQVDVFNDPTSPEALDARIFGEEPLQPTQNAQHNEPDSGAVPQSGGSATTQPAINKVDQETSKVTPIKVNGVIAIDENGNISDDFIKQIEQLKANNDKKGLNDVYSTVRILLNGVAQSKGDATVKQFENLKAELEDYAKDVDAKPTDKTQKQPWEMTREEYLGVIEKNTRESHEKYKGHSLSLKDDLKMSLSAGESNHKYNVKQALSEGKPVPAEVLKDYPELSKSDKPSNNKPVNTAQTPLEAYREEVKETTQKINALRARLTNPNAQLGDALGVGSDEAILKQIEKLQQEIQDAKKFYEGQAEREKLSNDKKLEFESNRWTERIQRNKEKAINDMTAYLASKSLGRNFNESVEAYYDRTGFTKAAEWMRGVINGDIKIPVKTEDTNTEQVVDNNTPNRIPVIGIGDLHGENPEQLKADLIKAGIINEAGDWITDKTIVQVGDVTDRGQYSEQLIDFLSELQKKADGKIVRILGNHDLAHLMKKAESVGGVSNEMITAKLREGVLDGSIVAAWSEGDTIYTHAGIDLNVFDEYYTETLTPAQIAKNLNEILIQAVKTNNFNHKIFSNDGIFWTRREIENDQFRQVVGHTVKSKQHTYKDGDRVKYIDTGRVFGGSRDLMQNTVANKPVDASPESLNIQSVLDEAQYVKRHKTGKIVRLKIDDVLRIQDPQYKVSRENQIGNRIDKAKQYLQSNPKSLEASVIYFRPDGTIGFEDGRHRLLAAQELGAEYAYFEVTDNKEQADALVKFKNNQSWKIDNSPESLNDRMFGEEKKPSKLSKLQQEADDAMKDFLDAFNDLNNDNLGIIENSAEKQAKMLVAGTKMIEAFTKLGYFKFADILRQLQQKGVQITEDLLSALKKAYGAFAAENDIDELDDIKTVRKFTLEELKVDENTTQPQTELFTNEQMEDNPQAPIVENVEVEADDFTPKESPRGGISTTQALEKFEENKQSVLDKGNNYDSKNITNKATVKIDDEILNEIAEKGITLERLESLNVPIFKYLTQITIHGIFNEKALTGINERGYKNLVLNKNKSLGVRYNGIDIEKKAAVQQALNLTRSSNKDGDVFSFQQNSYGVTLQKYAQVKNQEQLNAKLAEYRNQSDGINEFVGNKNVYVFRHPWFGVLVVSEIRLNAIPESGLESFINKVTNGYITSKQDLADKQAAHDKQSEKDWNDKKEQWRLEDERKDKEYQQNVKPVIESASYPVSKLNQSGDKFAIATIEKGSDGVTPRIRVRYFTKERGRWYEGIRAFSSWDDIEVGYEKSFFRNGRSAVEIERVLNKLKKQNSEGVTFYDIDINGISQKQVPTLVKPEEQEVEITEPISEVDNPQQDGTEMSAEEEAEGIELAGKIQDFGEKIGMARKDTAESGYTMTGKKGETKQPAWRAKYKVFSQENMVNVQHIGVFRNRTPLDPNKFTLAIVNGRQFRDLKINIDTKEEAEALIPLYEVALNHRVYASSKNKDEYSIYRRWSSGKLWEMKTGFKSHEEAMKYMAQNATEIINYKTPRIERPHLDRIERLGLPDRRKGNITPEQFMETFGFRGGEFGNWVAGDERQQMLNFAYDAFMDMAEVIGIPANALSLNGRLAIGFGSRGKGLSGAAAHFEPERGVINLTKINGAGALAHEWFHAFDSYFGMKDKNAFVPDDKGVIQKKIDSEKDYLSGDFNSNPNVRKEVKDAWKDVWEAMRYKTEQSKYDISRAESRIENAMNSLMSRLNSARSNMSRERSYGLRKKPATTEQLTKWDALIERVKNIDFGSISQKATKKKWSFDQEYDVQKQLDELYKEVTGRGFSDDLGYQIFRRVEIANEEKKRADEGQTFENKVATTFYRDSKEIDRARSSDYWSTNHEMSARAFEAFMDDMIKQAGGQNDYLVHSVNNAIYQMLYDAKPYPEGDERKAINEAFKNLFDVLETKEVDGKRVLFMDTPTFYSPTERALDYIRQEKGTAAQFKAMLLKNGAKQAEMDWMGWDEQFGDSNKMITKADIQQWIDGNKVEVEEVQKSDRPFKQLKEAFGNVGKEWKEIYGGVQAKMSDKSNEYEKRFNLKINGTEYSRDFTYIDAKSYIEANADVNPEKTRTKYSQYQLEGEKSNYKEVLVTLPKPVFKKGEWIAIPEEIDGFSGKEIIWRLKNRNTGQKSVGAYETKELAESEIKKGEKSGGKTDFQSSHFDEPNILAHVRFNERTDADGNKVLFIEEVQSDWAQKGKKEGFKGKALKTELSYIDYRTKLWEKYNVESVEALNNQASADEIATLSALWDKESNTGGKISSAVPDMPFKKTDQWVNLALRRMIKYAAENGFDRIAWTNGEMQAERYDLSKQVDEIVYNVLKDGKTRLIVKKNGEDAAIYDVEENEIESYVGKDVAEKIINGEGNVVSGGGKSLSGLDLKVGGEGMKAFYDAIVPAAAGKLGKPFGAKVESIEIKNIDINTFQEKPTHTIQSLPITQAMRESVIKGVPLFLIAGEKGAGLATRTGTAAAKKEANIRLDNKFIAEGMEQAGMDAQRIRMATGWERGNDGKWRYEIADGVFKNPGRPGMFNLAQLIDNKTLFAMYPNLQYMPVYLDITPDAKEGGEGSYSYPFGIDKINEEIEVIARNEEDARITLLHEVQHAIQFAEGFAQGASLNAFRTGKFTNEEITLLNAFVEGSQTPEQFLAENGALMRDMDMIDLMQMIRTYSKPQLKNAAKQANAKAYDKYYRQAGEVEARNVERRAGMTDEERRKTLLEATENVSREDQLFMRSAFDGRRSRRSSDESNENKRAVIEKLEKLRKSKNRAVIVDTVDELPKHVQNIIKNRNIQGMLYEGTTYYIIDNLADTQAAIDVWLHEQGVHYGITSLIPDSALRQSFFEQIFEDIGLDAIQKVVSKNDIKNFIEGKIDKALLGEEYMAYLANKKLRNLSMTKEQDSIWKRFVRAINEFFEKLFTGRVRITEDTVLRIAKAAIQQNFIDNESLLGVSHEYTRQMLRHGIGYSTGQIRRNTRTATVESLFGNKPRFQSSIAMSAAIPETITINGVKRPTTNSNGQQIHPTREGVEAFWRWFGESKVTDEQGRPLVVYHGTNNIDYKKSEFNEFITPAFFSNSPIEAEYYTNNRAKQGNNIMPIYLSIKNMIDFRNIPMDLNTSKTPTNHIYDVLSKYFNDSEIVNILNDASIIQKKLTGFSPIWTIKKLKISVDISKLYETIPIQEYFTKSKQIFQNNEIDDNSLLLKFKNLSENEKIKRMSDVYSYSDDLKTNNKFLLKQIADFEKRPDYRITQLMSDESISSNDMQILLFPILDRMGGNTKFLELCKKKQIDGVAFKDPTRKRLTKKQSDIPITYSVFNPSQIKSATGNTGTFDGNNPDIRFMDSDMPPFDPQQTTAQIFSKNGRINIHAAIEIVQDFHHRWDVFNKLIKERGGSVPEWADVYLHSTLQPGKNEAEISKYDREIWKPLEKVIADITKTTGITVANLEKYMKAKHAPERNAKIRKDVAEKPNLSKYYNSYSDNVKKFKEELKVAEADSDEIKSTEIKNKIKELKVKFFDNVSKEVFAGSLDGKPLTDEYAQQQIELYEAVIGQENAARLWEALNKATRFSVQKYRDAGFIDADTFDELTGENGYQFYVPLRGWKQDKAADIFEYQKSQPGSGFQNPFIAAKGRESEADDPLAYIRSMAYTAILSGNKNVFKQKALNLAQVNKDMNDLLTYNTIYSVDMGKTDDETGETVWDDALVLSGKVYVIEGFTDEGEPVKSLVGDYDTLKNEGKIKTESDHSHYKRNTKSNAKQHEVIVYRGGKRYIVVMKSDPVLGMILNNKNPLNPQFSSENMQRIFNAPASLTRTMSKLLTSLNPAFIPVNFIRDIGYATISQGIRHEGEIKLFYKNLNKSRKAIHRHIKGIADPKNNTDDAMFERFLLNGGRTGYAFMEDLEKHRTKIERELKRLAGTNNKLDKFTQSKAVQVMPNTIEYMAMMSEDISRYAIFLTSKAKGRSDAQAALDAKDGTVNFNRKGKIAPVLGMLYAFANASIQGGANFINLGMKNKKKFGAVAATMMAMGFLTAELMRWIWPDDDDEEDNFDGINEFLKDNYLILPNPAWIFGKATEKYISIPLPHGFRLFHAMGVMSSDMIHGHQDKAQLAGRFSNNFVNTFSPLAFDASVIGKKGELNARPFVPSWYMPVYDISSNEDFAGRRVFKEMFTPELERSTPEWQKGLRNTNKGLVEFSRALNNFAGGSDEIPANWQLDENGNWKEDNIRNFLNVNPAKLEHLLTGYTGGLGQFFNDMVKTTTSVIEVAAQQPDAEIQANDVPVLKRLYRTNYKQGAMEQYYDLKREVAGAKAMMRKLQPEDERYMMLRRNGELRTKMRLLESLEPRLEKIKDRIEKLSATEGNKDRIKELQDRREEILKSAFENLNNNTPEENEK